MTDIKELDRDTFDRRASMQSSEVPEGAATEDEYEWQTLRQVLADAGITPQVGDWVFGDAEFAFTEGAVIETEEDPPDEELTARLRQWGIGPDKAWALHGALKAADLTLTVTPREE